MYQPIPTPFFLGLFRVRPAGAVAQPAPQPWWHSRTLWFCLVLAPASIGLGKSWRAAHAAELPEPRPRAPGPTPARPAARRCGARP